MTALPIALNDVDSKPHELQLSMKFAIGHHHPTPNYASLS